MTSACGIAVQGPTPLMLQLALTCVEREGKEFVALPNCNGDACSWVRDVAQCIQRGDCRRAVVFCKEAGLACCVTNKVPGIRAVTIHAVSEAEIAIHSTGANVLIVDPTGRTFFEFKQVLRLGTSSPTHCPPGVEHVLQELEGNHQHAHR